MKLRSCNSENSSTLRAKNVLLDTPHADCGLKNSGAGDGVELLEQDVEQLRQRTEEAAEEKVVAEINEEQLVNSVYKAEKELEKLKVRRDGANREIFLEGLEVGSKPEVSSRRQRR